MEKKVLSYQDFSGMKFRDSEKATDFVVNGSDQAKNESHEHEKNYMFFQNMATVKHYIEEVMKMDKSAVDKILSDGHDWASDHLATAKDDIEEVTNFLRNEIQMGSEGEAQEENKFAKIETQLDKLGGEVKIPVDLFNDDSDSEESEDEDDEKEELVNVEMEEEDDDEEEGSEEESDEE